MTPIANNLPNHHQNNAIIHKRLNKLAISSAIPALEGTTEPGDAEDYLTDQAIDSQCLSTNGNQRTPLYNSSPPTSTFPSLNHQLTSNTPPASYRSHLNHSIHRYRLLRTGAQNLIQATTNRYIRETAALELCFVNSHLQLLREQLAELNGRCWDSGERENGRENSDGSGGRSIIKIPMICLGLKETNELGKGVEEGIKDFIHVHYSESPTPYEPAIQTFLHLRQSIRFPTLNREGISLLLQYLTVLYYVERRFFTSNSNEKQNGIGIWFEWYDSLTGIPSLQRTVAFEKASVLFNLAAIHTQIATSIINNCNQSQQNNESLSNSESEDDPFDASIDHFLRGAGTLRYIGDHFTNPPSFDLGSETLEGLIGVMIGQGRECLVEKAMKVGVNDRGVEETPAFLLDLSQESAHLSSHYHSLVTMSFTSPNLNPYIPPAWTALLQFKTHYYASLSNYYIAKILLRDTTNPLAKETVECFKYLYEETGDGDDCAVTTDIRAPVTQADRISLGKSHLRQSILNLEDGERVAKFSKELKSNRGILTMVNDLKNKLIDLGGMDGKDEQHSNDSSVLDPPRIIPSTKYQLALSPPDLATNAEDPFRALGPLALFSAKRHWSAPRRVVLRRVTSHGHSNSNGFGLSIKCSAPVVIASVDEGSSAEAANLAPGDIIVGINGQDTKWSTHEEIVNLVRNAGDRIEIRVVTMLDEKGMNMSTLSRRLSPGSGWSTGTGTSSCTNTSTSTSTSGASSSGTGSRGTTPRSKSNKPKHISKVVPFLQRSTGAEGLHNHNNNNVIYK